MQLLLLLLPRSLLLLRLLLLLHLHLLPLHLPRLLLQHLHLLQLHQWLRPAHLSLLSHPQRPLTLKLHQSRWHHLHKLLSTQRLRASQHLRLLRQRRPLRRQLQIWQRCTPSCTRPACNGLKVIQCVWHRPWHNKQR
jgi:hypothetical protein